MPLTPEDVSQKRFTPVRLREGYDMGEVDQFLDEVEAELERLLAENNDLRSKLSAAQDGAPVPIAKPEEKPEKAPEKAEVKPEKVDKAVEAEKPAEPQEVIKVITAAEASSAATRLLELATRNADEVVAEARDDARKIVTEAQGEAEKLESETKARTDKLEQDARTRAQNLDSETENKRRELLGEMEKEKGRLGGEIETLRSFEREYRSRLKSYFSQQLEALEGSGEGGGDLTGPPAAVPPGEDKPAEGQQGEDKPAEGDQPQG
jgi:DivIVA domain-containing protein